MSPDSPGPTGTAGPDLLQLELAETPARPPAVQVARPVDHDRQRSVGVLRAVPLPHSPVRTAVPESPSGAPVRRAAEQPTRLLQRPAPAEPATRKIALPPGDPHAEPEPGLPGSQGEHLLQNVYDTRKRAERFYNDQVLGHLNDKMIEFIGRMEMLFVSTADTKGECDASLRAGPPGFVQTLDAEHLAYPEYRGNGVMASLGNISENPHVGILMIDFTEDVIGLHVNGRARIVEDADLRREHPGLPTDFDRGRTPERWVVVEVEEAYIHCRKHIPRMVPISRDRPWGTDDAKRKGGDYFGAKALAKPWQPSQVGHRD